jgi:regulatory protein
MTIGQALERLQMLCCRCEYSTGQVRKKLLMWDMREKREGKPGFLPQEIDGAVEALVKERFVDDERFAGAYVRDKARFSKWGPAKIGYNLRMLGVEQPVIKRAVYQNPDPEPGCERC